MNDCRFSGVGDPPTVFEEQLLSCADQEDLWVLIGQRIGARALFILFDEIGGEKVNVPKREVFQQRLYRPLRDAMVRALSREQHLNNSEIAQRTGLSRQTVGVILAQSGAPHPGDDR